MDPSVRKLLRAFLAFWSFSRNLAAHLHQLQFYLRWSSLFQNPGHYLGQGTSSARFKLLVLQPASNYREQFK